jgi:hypothetical protein
MPGIYPNPSACAENFKVGDQVRWFVSDKDISPYIGVVTQSCPAIQKVWVEFPVGGNQQKDPTELIMVTPFTGQATVSKDTGYSSYSKQLSDEAYGTLGETTMRMAQKMVAEKTKKASEDDRIMKMASRIASEFATKVVDRLASDVLACIEKKMTDIQAYQSVYPDYETICSDGFLRTAVSKIYEVSGIK